MTVTPPANSLDSWLAASPSPSHSGIPAVPSPNASFALPRDYPKRKASCLTSQLLFPDTCTHELVRGEEMFQQRLLLKGHLGLMHNIPTPGPHFTVTFKEPYGPKWANGQFPSPRDCKTLEAKYRLPANAADSC